MAKTAQPTNAEIMRLLEAIQQHQEQIARDVARLLKR